MVVIKGLIDVVKEIDMNKELFIVMVISSEIDLFKVIVDGIVVVLNYDVIVL